VSIDLVINKSMLNFHCHNVILMDERLFFHLNWASALIVRFNFAKLVKHLNICNDFEGPDVLNPFSTVV
jgi:hypothetical protein